MARQTIETTIKTEQDDVATPGLPALADALHQVDAISAIEAGYSDQRDYFNRLVGQMDMAAAISKFTDVVSLSKIKIIKESKAYRSSKGIKLPMSGIILDGTWDNFCRYIIRKSASAVDEDLANIEQFGETALEAMQQAGIGYRELRQYRKLPVDEKTALIEAAKEGDKETLLDLAETLLTKSAADKAALVEQAKEVEKKLSETEGDLEASRRRVAEKDEEINNLKTRVEKLSNKAGDWHPRTFEIAMENTRILGQTIQGLDQLDTLRDVILNEDFGDQDREAAIEHMAVVYYDAIDQLTGRLAEISHACDTVFIGYKEKARPILDVFGPQGEAE